MNTQSHKYMGYSFTTHADRRSHPPHVSCGAFSASFRVTAKGTGQDAWQAFLTREFRTSDEAAANAALEARASIDRFMELVGSSDQPPHSALGDPIRGR